jgi:hypothetical protein
MSSSTTATPESRRRYLALFLGAGIIPAGLAVWLGYGSWQKIHSWTPTTATATGTLLRNCRETTNSGKHSAGSCTQVSFLTTDGTTVVTTVPHIVGTGEKLEIAYDPVDPKMATDLSFTTLWRGPTFLAFFTIFWIGVIIGAYRQGERAERLRQTGVRFTATVTDVAKMGYEDGTIIWGLRCEGTNPLTGSTGMFASDITTENLPGRFQKGQLAAVYINPAKPSEYVVDISGPAN